MTELAKYRIDQKSYMNDRIVEKGEEVEVSPKLKPGPHWFPLNDAAKKAAEEGGVKYTGEVPDVLGALMPMFEKAVEQHGSEKLTPANLATAFAGALERVLGKKTEGMDDAAIKSEVDRRVAEELEKLTGAEGKGSKGGKKSAADIL